MFPALRKTRPVHLRTYRDSDFDRLLALTIDVFGPFYEESFPSSVGGAIATHQHGNWREDYRVELTGLHDPDRDKHVVVAETGDRIVGFAAWAVNRSKRHGDVEFVAVESAHRRDGVAQSLCEHVFEAMRRDGVEVVEIGTGGDSFHAPARAFYESLGMTPLPVVVYFKEL